MSKKREELLGILIPQGTWTYLVPNVTIAEILNVENLIPKEKKSPAWMVGKLNWRNQKIPLIHLNLLVQNTSYGLHNDDSGELARVALITPLLQPGPPKYGIYCNKIPKLARIKPTDLTLAKSQSESMKIQANHPSTACAVRFGKESIFIPNLLWIEELINSHEQALA